MALALRPSAGARDRYELVRLPLGESDRAEWTRELPEIGDPRLTAVADGWRVSGIEQRDGMPRGFLSLAGTSAGAMRSSLHLALNRGSRSRWDVPAWTPLGERAALAVTFEDPAPGAFSLLGLFGAGPFESRSRLWRVDLRGAELLAESRLTPVCLPREADAVCAVDDGEWLHLWRVAAEGPPRPCGVIRRGLPGLAEVRANRALLYGVDSRPTLIARWNEKEALPPLELRVEDRDALRDVSLVGTDRLAVLFASDQGRRTVLYRIEP